MTVPTRRLLPLACTLWILALFAVQCIAELLK